VSYLNIDVGCSGPIPEFGASPELHDIIEDVMKKVIYPNTGSVDLYPEQTLYDVYLNTSGSIEVLGSGSDYTAFLHRGVGSADIGAGNGPDDPVYHYHSNYDSYAWMVKYGDPEFAVHVAIGQFLSLLAYHLSNDEIIPFNITTWGEELSTYQKDLEQTISSSTCCTALDLSELSDAIDTFKSAAEYVEALRSKADESGDEDLIQIVNQKYRDFQRGFTSQGGLPGGDFYRHVAFAPGSDTGYAPVTFPGITEATLAGNFSVAEEWVGKTSAGILAAADLLTD
jgi:N-acetylated-alpha-linked acidic dipeptidase